MFKIFFSEGLFAHYLIAPAANETRAMLLFICAAVLCMTVSYLLGSLNFAIIISGKTYRQDIRNHGSKNAGMTNMMRTYGKKAAALTLLGDMLKAVVSCLIGYALIGQLGAYIAGLFCMIGHIFPVFYRFKGGKGVACAGMGPSCTSNRKTFGFLEK
jgi:glycerol-3-phosphate acyltransferase PlsY